MIPLDTDATLLSEAEIDIVIDAFLAGGPTRSLRQNVRALLAAMPKRLDAFSQGEARQLAGFSAAILGGFTQTAALTGGDLHDLGISHGLLYPERHMPSCKNGCACAEAAHLPLPAARYAPTMQKVFVALAQRAPPMDSSENPAASTTTAHKTKL